MLVHKMIMETLRRRPEMVYMFEYYEGLKPSGITQTRLFREVCWIVYSSGFSHDVLTRYWPAIGKAFSGFDTIRVAENDAPISEIARRVCQASGFRNFSKAAWCIENAKRICALDEELNYAGGIEGFFQLTSEKSLEEVVSSAEKIAADLNLRGIGKTTVFHLLKNMGIDTFKPDIHVRRMLAGMKLIRNCDASPKEICNAMTFLSSVSGYRVSQVDTFLFAYGITAGDKIQLA